MMICIKNIPHWLINSYYYDQIILNGLNFIEIKANQIKYNDNIESYDDFILLINTIKFWKLKELPQSLYDFVINNIYNSFEYLYKYKSNQYIHNIITELLMYASFNYNNISVRQYNFLNKLKEEFHI